tara:strand:+ start:69 stop:497 length:429 start_codon:yes stop_codon:yes gene_type:complete
MAVYISDLQLTNRLPSTIGSSDIDDATKRLDSCITPASAIIDSVYPIAAPFTATPSAPSLIQSASLEYALFFAHSILGKGKLAEAAWDRAEKLLNIDPDTGLARAHIDGVSLAHKRIRTFDLARSVDAEDRDTDDDEAVLYP